MKAKNRYRRHCARGFTLIEIVVVMVIIVILAGMTLNGVSWYKRKAAVGKTTVLKSSICRALEEYRLDNGSFPVAGGGNASSGAVYKALYGDADLDGKVDDGATVYLTVLNPDLVGAKRNVEKVGGNYVIVDSWGNPFRYQSPAQMNPANDFDLWSFGPDGRGGPTTNDPNEIVDDIKNW